jgi:hypothetical protein
MSRWCDSEPAHVKVFTSSVSIPSEIYERISASFGCELEDLISSSACPHVVGSIELSNLWISTPFFFNSWQHWKIGSVCKHRPILRQIWTRQMIKQHRVSFDVWRSQKKIKKNQALCNKKAPDNDRTRSKGVGGDESRLAQHKSKTWSTVNGQSQESQSQRLTIQCIYRT